MTQRQVARLACKLLAIYAVIMALDELRWTTANLFAAISAFRYAGSIDAITYLGPFLVPLIQFVFALWLWKRAGVVAAWICGHDLQDDMDEPDAVPVRADIDAWQGVAISSMGVWVMITVIPRIVTQAMNFTIEWLLGGVGARRAAGAVSWEIWIWLTQFGIGLWLIFGCAGIVKGLRRFRPRAAEVG